MILWSGAGATFIWSVWLKKPGIKTADNYNGNAFCKWQGVKQGATDNYLVDEKRMTPSPRLRKMAQKRLELWLGSVLEGIHSSLLWPLSRRIMGYTEVNWPHTVTLRAGGQTHCSSSDSFVSRIRLCHTRIAGPEIKQSNHYSLKMIGLGNGATVKTSSVINCINIKTVFLTKANFTSFRENTIQLS